MQQYEQRHDTVQPAAVARGRWRRERHRSWIQPSQPAAAVDRLRAGEPDGAAEWAMLVSVLGRATGEPPHGEHGRPAAAAACRISSSSAVLSLPGGHHSSVIFAGPIESPRSCASTRVSRSGLAEAPGRQSLPCAASASMNLPMSHFSAPPSRLSSASCGVPLARAAGDALPDRDRDRRRGEWLGLCSGGATPWWRALRGLAGGRRRGFGAMMIAGEMQLPPAASGES